MFAKSACSMDTGESDGGGDGGRHGGGAAGEAHDGRGGTSACISPRRAAAATTRVSEYARHNRLMVMTIERSAAKRTFQPSA
jgi:hypothetical protein